LARLVRLLAAALLLCAALLVVALVGSGVAAAEDAVDGGVLPGAGTADDGSQTSDAALPASPGTLDGVHADYQRSLVAVAGELSQPVLPSPEAGGQDAGGVAETLPGSSRHPGSPRPAGGATVPDWEQALRPEQPETVRRRVVVTGDGDGEEPTGTDVAAGLVYDLDELRDADRSLGPLDQYPRDDQGVVQLPVVTVTAKPVAVPDQAPGTPLAAGTPPGGQPGDATSLVGDAVAGGFVAAEVTGTAPHAAVMPPQAAVPSRSPAAAATSSRGPDAQPPAPAGPVVADGGPARLTGGAAPPSSGPRLPGRAGRGPAASLQPGAGSRSAGGRAAGPVAEDDTRTAVAGPARTGSRISRARGALANLGTPAAAAAAVTAAPTASLGDHRNSVPRASPDAVGTDPEYYQDAARAAAAGFVGGMLATYAWLLVLALVGTRVPAPPPPVLGVTMGLMGAAIILQAYFILNPPPTDAEWATQRFWSVAAVGLSVALAALPILLTVSVSVPAAIIAAGAVGVITAILDHRLWSAANPRPSSVPRPDATPPPRKIQI